MLVGCKSVQLFWRPIGQQLAKFMKYLLLKSVKCFQKSILKIDANEKKNPKIKMLVKEVHNIEK